MLAKILVFSGSTREGSLNLKLANALTMALSEKGAETTHLNLADYPLPVFNGDLEMPENAEALSALFCEADGLVISSPEYNSSLSPLLKNTIDWVSTTKTKSDQGFGPYVGKICFIAACSPGALGGIRGLYHLRSVLMNVGAEIITSQLAVGNGGAAFDEEGRLVDERHKSMMETGLASFLRTIEAMKSDDE